MFVSVRVVSIEKPLALVDEEKNLLKKIEDRLVLIDRLLRRKDGQEGDLVARLKVEEDFWDLLKFRGNRS